MSETRKYRKFAAQQKTEVVLAPLRGKKTITRLCRDHDISQTVLRRWREQFSAAELDPRGRRAGVLGDHRHVAYRHQPLQHPRDPQPGDLHRRLTDQPGTAPSASGGGRGHRRSRRVISTNVAFPAASRTTTNPVRYRRRP